MQSENTVSTILKIKYMLALRKPQYIIRIFLLSQEVYVKVMTQLTLNIDCRLRNGTVSMISFLILLTAGVL